MTNLDNMISNNHLKFLTRLWSRQAIKAVKLHALKTITRVGLVRKMLPEENILEGWSCNVRENIKVYDSIRLSGEWARRRFLDVLAAFRSKSIPPAVMATTLTAGTTHFKVVKVICCSARLIFLSLMLKISICLNESFNFIRDKDATPADAVHAPMIPTIVPSDILPPVQML